MSARVNKVIFNNFAANSEMLGVCPTTSDSEYWMECELLNRKKRNIINYATFEAGGIDLTDKKLVMVEDTDYIGYFSKKISTKDKDFSPHVKISVELSPNRTYSSPGVTLRFHQNFCTEVQIDYYRNSAVIDSSTYYPDALDYFCEREVTGYTGIYIFFKKTETPYQAVKLRGIDLGKEIEITDFVGNIEIFEEISPDYSDAPGGTCDFEAIIKEEVAPQRGQELNVYSNEEYFGRFFIEKVTQTGKDMFVFECFDCAVALDASQMTELPYKKYSELTAKNIAEQITEASGIEIDCGGLGEQPVEGFIAAGTSCRVAAAMLSFATAAFVSGARSDKIRLVAADTNADNIITSNRILGKATYEQKAELTSYEIYYWNPNFSTPATPIGMMGVKNTYTINPQYSNVKVYDRFSLTGYRFNNFYQEWASTHPPISFELSEIKAKIIYQGERVGQIIKIETAYDGTKRGLIKSLELSIGAQITANITLVERGVANG